MAELLSQSTAGGDTYAYDYGRPDTSGVPEIEGVTLTTGGSTYRAYVAHDPTGTPVAIQTSSGTIALYVYDNRDNPVGLVTDFGTTAYLYQFDPYGGATTTQNSGGTGYPQNPYVFAGGLPDRSTGLIRYGARWYDPTTGTWTQQDTLNAPLAPGTANRYDYTGDDPINSIDPTGYLLGCDVGTVTGGVGGAIVGGGIGFFAGGPAGLAVGGSAGAGLAGGYVDGACNSGSNDPSGRALSGVGPAITGFIGGALTGAGLELLGRSVL